jgi:hypothetical protein
MEPKQTMRGRRPPSHSRRSTGKTTRLTGNPEWDEDGALSPDGKLQVVASWRTRDRFAVTAWLPQVRGYTGLPFGAALANLYVSSWPGFQCDLSPWLLPGSGDDNGRLIGQPLDVYAGDFTAGNNLSGHAFWSPDAPRVLLQEKLRRPVPPGSSRSVTQKGLTPNRIAIAHIDRKPGPMQPIVASRVGDWAPTVEQWRGAFAADQQITVKGDSGGSAVRTFRGNIAVGGASVTFNRFADDGVTFVDGTMSGGSEDGKITTIKVDVHVSGANTGAMKADLMVKTTDQPPSFSGSWSAMYNGKDALPLPPLGACYDTLPKPSKLMVEVKRTGKNESVTVTTNVYGDVRPVQNATVGTEGKTLKTNGDGQVFLPLTAKGKHKVIMTAGDTFIANQAIE